MSGRHLIGFCGKVTRERIDLLAKWTDLTDVPFDQNKKFVNINTTNIDSWVTLQFKIPYPEDLLEI